MRNVNRLSFEGFKPGDSFAIVFAFEDSDVDDTVIPTDLFAIDFSKSFYVDLR